MKYQVAVVLRCLPLTTMGKRNERPLTNPPKQVDVIVALIPPLVARIVVAVTIVVPLSAAVVVVPTMAAVSAITVPTSTFSVSITTTFPGSYRLSVAASDAS